MADPQLCQTCSTVNTRKQIIACGSCRKVFHLSCVRLTRNQARTIPRWCCSECLDRGGAVNIVGDPLQADLVQFIAQCRANSRVLRIIPKGAIICVADALQKLFDRAIGENTPLAWGRLLGFAYWGIRQPGRDRDDAGRCPSLATRVKRQVADFMEADCLSIPPGTSMGGGSGSDDDLKLRRSVSAKFADGDIRGAVKLLASSDGVAPRDDTTLNLLQRKHPCAPDDLSLPAPPGQDFPAPIAGEEDVRKALSSFRPGSAGGPDGLRPGHLSALISRKAAEAGGSLLASLTRFVNLMLRGEVPEFARSVLYGASLFALGKKDGGVRPIAVGSTLRRLATKVGAWPLSSGIGETLRPVQVGVSSKGGCEAAVHAARRYSRDALHRRVLFKVDMANAFNSLRRDVFLAAAREKARSLYRLLWQAYSENTTLFYGDASLVSATGIQQGDPFGPALFSLAIDSLIRELSVEFNVWYLDDGTLGDTPERVLDGVRRLIDGLRGLGLEINQRKCELIMLNHSRDDESRTERLFRELLPELEVVPLTNSSLLGAPLSEEGIRDAILERRADLERMVARLKLIENHQAFVLLKNCFALPKLQYLLRASPAYKRRGELSRFDDTLVAALSAVTNVRFEGDSLVQASLPVRLGGLGITMSKDIALPAFISSLHSVCGLVEGILNDIPLPENNELQAAEEDWRSTGLSLAEGVNVCRQSAWSGPRSEAAAAELLEGADQISRARLVAAACRESGLWLHTLPTLTLGTLLDPESFRIAIALRVGATVCEPHACRCGRRMDARGLHGLSCKYSAGRHPRHAALNDVIRRGLQSAGIPSVLEPPGVDRGDGKRPDGITVFPFSNGKGLCWDATCIDTYAESVVVNSAMSAGFAARGAEERKRRKYATLGTRFRFEPVAVETTGVYGESTGVLISEIGRRISEATGEHRETLWLQQRLGLAVQRGNAYSILAAVRAKYDGDSGNT